MTKTWILIALLPIQVLFVHWIGDRPGWVENYYSQGIYPYLSSALRITTAWIPFPLGQIVFYSLIFYFLLWIWRGFRQMKKGRVKPYRHMWEGAKKSVAMFSLIYFLFMLVWGLNYRRQPVAKIAELDTSAPTSYELQVMCKLLVEECNQVRRMIDTKEHLPLSNETMLASAIEGFEENENYPFLHYSNPSVKEVLVPKLMSLFSVGGIYFMFTGEANINMDPPNFLTPATLCHEMAHQLGFASEDEANYIGYLATQLHPDKNFNYSGDLMALRYSMRSLYQTDSIAYHDLVGKLDDIVLADLKKTRDYWQGFYNPLDPLTDKIYDLFLKANKQEAGILSYSLVVRLLVAEYRKSKFNFTKQKPTKADPKSL